MFSWIVYLAVCFKGCLCFSSSSIQYVYLHHSLYIHFLLSYNQITRAVNTKVSFMRHSNVAFSTSAKWCRGCRYKYDDRFCRSGSRDMLDSCCFPTLHTSMSTLQQVFLFYLYHFHSGRLLSNIWPFSCERSWWTISAWQVCVHTQDSFAWWVFKVCIHCT